MEYGKVDRVLKIYDKLINKEIINKKSLADEFDVNIRTVQRDIDDIRSYLSDNYESESILYDHEKHGYYLSRSRSDMMSTVEIFSIIKILLESRAFSKDEMYGIVKSVFSYVPKLEAKNMKQLILNELYHFQPISHDKPILKMIWDLGQCILKKEIIEINFMKTDGSRGKRIVYPLSVVFSEYYFYLVAKIEDSQYDNPAFFRVDRIDRFKMMDRKYDINRYEEGELKRRVMFMYGGDLMKIVFRYRGTSIEHIIDRFPICSVKNIDDGLYEFEVEVYGKGCIMWFLSQGDSIEILSPDSLRDEIVDRIRDMMNIYEK